MHAYSGTGGSFYQIFTPHGDTLRAIGDVQGSIVLFEGDDGWLRIEGGSRAGGGQSTRYLLAYRDGAYVEVRNESHNHMTGKVEIRHTEPQRGASSSAPLDPEDGSR